MNLFCVFFFFFNKVLTLRLTLLLPLCGLIVFREIMLGFIDSADSHLLSTRSCGACSLHSSHRHALEEIKKVPISKRQILCLIALAYGNFCVAACVSLQAPFFPAECDNKGVSSLVYGLIFGIYELVILTASPIFGKMVNEPRDHFHFL